MYVDAALHAAFTGSPVVIDDTPGSPFTAFEGLLTGSMLATQPGSLVVQSWRSPTFGEGDGDSTVMLTFLPDDDGGGRIELVHLDVPEHDLDGVAAGWKSHYWEPWRLYLEQELARLAEDAIDDIGDDQGTEQGEGQDDDRGDDA